MTARDSQLVDARVLVRCIFRHLDAVEAAIPHAVSDLSRERMEGERAAYRYVLAYIAGTFNILGEDCIARLRREVLG